MAIFPDKVSHRISRQLPLRPGPLSTGHCRIRLNLLVRAKTEQEARERLWQSLQLHFTFPGKFLGARKFPGCASFEGDLTGERFGP